MTMIRSSHSVITAPFITAPLLPVAFLAAALSLLLTPAASRAEQFVLFDTTFTYTKADADNSTPSKSHYYLRGTSVNPKRPRDWTSPVDYRNGTVHIRTEVLEKPAGGEGVQWSLCYIPNRGQGNGYGCTGTDVYKEKGVYEKDVSMTAFWENNGLVWTEGIKQMDLVMKDREGNKVHTRPDPEKFFPTRVRITMIQVSAGSKYDPSLVPGIADNSRKPEQDRQTPKAPTIPGEIPLTPTPDAKTESGVYIPTDLDAALKELRHLLPPGTIAEMKRRPEAEMIRYHMGLGTWLRNNWGLWGGARLAKWFNSRGIHHPDDMSGILLTSLWRSLNGKPLLLDAQIKEYQEFWKQSQKERAEEQPPTKKSNEQK